MSSLSFDRRDFLRTLGLSGAAATLAGCGNTSIESGAEQVMSYVHPQDFVVPGVGVYYASTCTQCGSGCGVMGRVREGRILKLEGNPLSNISAGKICGLGQAAVQAHYNPDRIRNPLLRKDGKLVPVSWEQARAALHSHLGPASTVQGHEIAFLTGEISGHQRVLLQSLLESFGSSGHVVYEAVSTATGRAANQAMFGTGDPLWQIDRAHLILSFGSDFLATGPSPVHMAQQYAKFRKAPRGTLIQIEPRMTLTGGNADRWYPIRPGTEGVFALGLANNLLQHPEYARSVPATLVEALKSHDPGTVAEVTGIHADVIAHLTGMLWNKSPSLVLTGASALGQVNGYGNAQAIQLLNLILQNRGQTVTGQAAQPFPQLTALAGSNASLQSLHRSMAAGEQRVLLIMGANPVFTAPTFIPFVQSMSRVPFKVAFVLQMDETARECDLVLPLLSSLEDFGTHVAGYQPAGVELQLQQPLMEKLYPDTRGFGDLMLELLKMRVPDSYKGFPDYYSFIKTAVLKAKPVFKSTEGDEEFWEDALRNGLVRLNSPATGIEANLNQLKPAAPKVPETDPRYPFFFVPSVRADLRDGRNAHLPWLQESPETMTTIVWDSWVEIHPETAREMQIREGDVLEIQSATSTLLAKAYLFPGVQRDTVSMPVGQGHSDYGRYASGVGVNPFKLINPLFDAHTGELADHATRVSIRNTGRNEMIVKDEGPTNVQHERKLVLTMAADVAELGKENARVAE